MNIEERIEKLEEYVVNHEEDIKNNKVGISNNSQKIDNNTGAIAVLKTIKSYNNRFFYMWLITFIGLILSVGYNIYLLNDISQVTTQEVEQSNDSGDNKYIGRDGDIYG